MLFLFNLLINTDDKYEYIIDKLELCYNIYIFNMILTNKYREIHQMIKDKIAKKADISQNKTRDFYFIKFIENTDDINQIYFPSKYENASILLKYNNKIDSIKYLENNIDIIVNLFAPFCISYKK